MCQHSWYDKNRRHYGRKPNTRRARGLPSRALGVKRGPTVKKPIETLPAVGVDRDVKLVEIPMSMLTIRKYSKMYNWYVDKYQMFYDKEICMQMTAEKFHTRIETVKKAIDVCKMILTMS